MYLHPIQTLSIEVSVDSCVETDNRPVDYLLSEIFIDFVYFLFCFPPEYAEADSFYCLQALFSFEIRDFFLKSLDDSGSGIKQKMVQLSQLLKQKDPEVYERLEQQNLYPQYYSFRWLTLILSQEFPLPDVVRIWDSVFADENRFDFLVRICCAMIV